MKQIIIQSHGSIVSHWHFAHVGCDCYGFINYRTKLPQWEPTNLAVSGATAIKVTEFAKTLKDLWPDHTISHVI